MVTTTTVLKKGPWSVAEDVILMDYVRKHGEGNWNSVQKKCGLARCGKSCRLRWANHLRPNLKKGSFTPEEEMLILQLHAQYGNKWARMAAQIPGRTDNEIKNYWNTRIKRRQRAGLPLYPTRMSSARRPPLMVPSSPSSPLQHSEIQQMSSACPPPLMAPSSPSSPLQHSAIQPPPLMVPSSPSSPLQHSVFQQMSSACPPLLMVPSSPSSPLQHSVIQPPPPLLMVPSSPSSPLQHSVIQPPPLMVPSSPSSPLQHSAIQQMSSACQPPLMVPSTSFSPLQHSAILHSPLQLSEQPALLNPLMPESPRVKRIRDDGLTFQFPVGSPYMHQHQPQQSTGVVATTTMTTNNMFQYNNNNTYGNSQNFNEMNMNILMSTTVLPSTKLSNGGDGGCGLMDALLQNQGGELVFSDQPPIINENGSNGDDKDLFVDLLPRFEELSCSNGIGMKRKQSELEEANPESTHDNISKLMDMISTPAMPPPPEWQTLTTTDSCEISNGGQPSVVADDELGLELQHLASSLSPADQEWNIGSCPWNNMSGIG